MNDNQIITAVISLLNAFFSSQSITVGIKQAYQPRQQGTPSNDTVFLHKLGDKAYGYPVRSDVYVSAGQTVHTEAQLWETSFQINALAIQNPENLTQLTPFDYVRYSHYALSSEAGLLALKTAGLGLLRITTLNQTWFKDEESRYESDPSFSFTVTHKQIVTVTIPSTLEVVSTFSAAN